jgi:histidine triad (HIT) family protein
MGCPFCAIVAGEVEASVVARARGATAFLDARPLFPGHVLVVPDRHADTLCDLAPDGIEPLFALVQRVAVALERGLDAGGSFSAINTRISQSVPHLHVHVVPRRKGDGLRGFFWPRQGYASVEEREQVRAAIAGAIEAGG